MRATNAISLRCLLFSPVHTVNCVQTPKVLRQSSVFPQGEDGDGLAGDDVGGFKPEEDPNAPRPTEAIMALTFGRKDSAEGSAAPFGKGKNENRGAEWSLNKNGTLKIHERKSISCECSFVSRILYSMMPLVHTPARLKLLHVCDQWHSSRVFIPFTS
jgi:hypothetical protein